jgi:hypothetical protein
MFRALVCGSSCYQPHRCLVSRMTKFSASGSFIFFSGGAGVQRNRHMGHLRNLRGTLLCVFVFVRVRVLVHYVHTYTDITRAMAEQEYPTGLTPDWINHLPPEVVERKLFRQHPFTSSHLRYAFLPASCCLFSPPAFRHFISIIYVFMKTSAES